MFALMLKEWPRNQVSENAARYRWANMLILSEIVCKEISVQKSLSEIYFVGLDESEKKIDRDVSVKVQSLWKFSI